MKDRDKIRVLFVCMGNICRSPTAHGVFRGLVELQGLASEIDVDSAGTIGYHIGAQPDHRSQATAMQRGIDISDLQARKVVIEDFSRFDYILAMDQANLHELLSTQPHGSRASVSLLLQYSEQWRGQEVPDPYYGGEKGFDDVFDRVEDGCVGLLEFIARQKGL